MAQSLLLMANRSQPDAALSNFALVSVAVYIRILAQETGTCMWSIVRLQDIANL